MTRSGHDGTGQPLVHDCVCFEFGKYKQLGTRFSVCAGRINYRQRLFMSDERVNNYVVCCLNLFTSHGVVDVGYDIFEKPEHIY